jgi:molecular chaperone GrpE
MVKVSMGPGPESSSDAASEQPQEGDA